MILGNIVTNKKIDSENHFTIYSFDDEIIDKSLPTLYIGFYDTQTIFPELDSTNRKISEKVFWTFSQNESRNYFVKDFFDFKIFSYYYKITGINYYFINPFKKYYEIKNILKFFNDKNSLKTVICDNGMVYMYDNKKIFGWDLNFNKFCNIDKNKLLKKIKEKSVKLEYEQDISDDIKLFSDIIEDKKYLPFLI